MVILLKLLVINIISLSCISCSCRNNTETTSITQLTTAEAEIYLQNLPKIDKSIDLGALTTMASGGTHRLYKDEMNSKFLLKVLIGSIGRPLKELRKDLELINQKYKKLYSIFGEDNCLVERRFIRKIEDVKNSSTGCYAIISVVCYNKAFENKDRFGFNLETTERNEVKVRKYTKKYHELNKGLLGSKHDYEDFDIGIFLEFEPTFKRIFALIDQNKSLRIAMKDFLAKVRKFYQKTDFFLDLKGIDNVIFYSTELGWRYKVGSVIKNETGIKFKKMLEKISTNPLSINDSFEQWALIFYVPSWIRGLNATARKLEMEKVIQDIYVSPADSEKLAKIHLYLPLSSRAVYYGEKNDFEKARQLFSEYMKTEKNYETWPRDFLGVTFWEYLKSNDSSVISKENIELFLSFLVDPRNRFPACRHKIVKAAVEGLLHQLEQKAKIDYYLKLKSEILLLKLSSKEN